GKLQAHPASTQLPCYTNLIQLLHGSPARLTASPLRYATLRDNAGDAVVLVSRMTRQTPTRPTIPAATSPPPSAMLTPRYAAMVSCAPPTISSVFKRLAVACNATADHTVPVSRTAAPKMAPDRNAPIGNTSRPAAKECATANSAAAATTAKNGCTRLLMLP